jgi:signal transduction histidine kinase
MNEIYNLNSSEQPEYNKASIAANDYEFLFSNMITGFALHEIITDENQNPIDYRYLAVNPEFEKLTGFKSENILGKSVKEILPPILSQYKVNARSKNIDFDFHYDILPNIYGDEYSIGQIFSNLVDNAIKYTNTGFVKLKVFESNEKNIVVRIADSGIGISEEYLEKIFEPFSQEEQGYCRSYDGNGLGLALVKRYCKINNAEIDVISEKGKGSSFQITFNGLE